MSVNLAVKQKLLDKIESLSEDQISNVLQFVDSLPNLKNNSEDVTYKAWQPCDPYDAIEKLTLLLETDKLNNSPKTGAELVNYWQKEGLINCHPEIKDSQEYASKIRYEAEHRQHL